MEKGLRRGWQRGGDVGENGGGGGLTRMEREVGAAGGKGEGCGAEN